MFDCLACKTSRVKTHTAHTRNEKPPLLCRFPHVQPVAYPCPGCKADRPANHSSHTNVERECRALEVRRREGKKRAGGLVRDPGVRASGDADDRRRQTDDDENPADDPAHDPPPPALEGAASSSSGSHGPMAGADPSHAREEEISQGDDDGDAPQNYLDDDVPPVPIVARERRSRREGPRAERIGKQDDGRIGEPSTSHAQWHD